MWRGAASSFHAVTNEFRSHSVRKKLIRQGRTKYFSRASCELADVRQCSKARRLNCRKTDIEKLFWTLLERENSGDHSWVVDVCGKLANEMRRRRARFTASVCPHFWIGSWAARECRTIFYEDNLESDKRFCMTKQRVDAGENVWRFSR